MSLTAAPAFAHHSFAMFDREKNTTVEGTIKEFPWTNPHCWVQLVVRDPATGKEVEWSLEGNGPNGLSRRGWTRTSLKPGDKAVVVIHPMRDGTLGGQLGIDRRPADGAVLAHPVQTHEPVDGP